MLKSLFTSHHDKLATAIVKGDEERTVRLLGKLSADALQQVDNDGRPLLELAIRSRQPRILQLLLQRTPAPLPKASCGTPLTVLALQQTENSLHLLSALLRAGADSNLIHTGRPLLHHCIEYCREAELMLHLSRLLEHGADINQPDKTGTTLLLRLLPTGNLPLLQFLLQSGAKCEPQWLESMEDPALLSQLRRTLDDIKIRNMMLGR